QTRDEAGGDRISRDCENDRDDRRCLLCRDGWRGCHRYNDGDLEPDELGRNLGETLVASLSPAILNGDGSILDPAEFAQPLIERGDPLALDQRPSPAQVPDGGQPPRLLRARRKRPRRRAAEQGEELPPPLVHHGTCPS